jgi:hypothetical protein
MGINLNKQYILNPSDSLNKDMEKTEMELKILREKKVNGIITRAKAKWQVFNNFLFSRFCYKWILAIKEKVNMGFIDNRLSAPV